MNARSLSRVLHGAVLASAFVAGLAQAADDKPNTAQQNKMVTCQKEAGDKKLEGADRKAFVTECLKTKKTQAQKLGACSKEAASKGLKGEERNQYLSTCAKAA
jgi:hypothetical protein